MSELHAALVAREHAESDVRKAVAALLQRPQNVDLQGTVRLSQIRERVARIRYATALQAAGWAVPEDLLDDVPDCQRP
ncbi:hypothetical protein ABN028_24225 [Actinopolymorpha sp. B17G11]|uniref:hypothetical protein n=1 Tax=Actinopolymorpha sp. B17G11 TaxID=3160861 RepID=UPI0032E4F193